MLQLNTFCTLTKFQSRTLSDVYNQRELTHMRRDALMYLEKKGLVCDIEEISSLEEESEKSPFYKATVTKAGFRFLQFKRKF